MKNRELLQGDLIQECPKIRLLGDVPEDDTPVEAEMQKYNVIVLSQSCDIKQGKIGLVLVCPYWELNEFVKKDKSFGSNKRKEALRRDELPGFHMLINCDIQGFESDLLIVDFRNVFGVSFDVILELAEKSDKRIRLVPPYREHLSQAFARFFMRVGLPEDIPSFL